MFRKIRIRKHELGLVFRHGDFERLLQPGSYWMFGRLSGRDRVLIVDTLKPRFVHPLLDLLVQDEALRDELQVVDLAGDQRAFVWVDGALDSILGPGRYAFWRRPRAVEIEVRDVSEWRLEHDQIDAILAHDDAGKYLLSVHGEARERVLFFQEGRLVASADEGLNVFWRQARSIDWKSVDLREQVADVAGQEIMTADKVTLRVNLVVAFRVLDAERAVTVVDDYHQALYREAQLALRAAVGGRELDALLADKEAVGAEVREAIASRAADFGLEVRSVGLRDVILPGDMKTILNQVIEAEKQAEANLIRRREETAAARSQANTAKLLAQNPALARMKELEILQEILAGSRATFLFGQGDLAGQVRDLVAGARVADVDPDR